MMNTINFPKASMSLGLLALTLVVLASPFTSSAATYAYVNTQNDVAVVEASSPTVALATAPGLHLHSGVILLKTAADFWIVGDQN